jgi:serine/threonine protein kinase
MPAATTGPLVAGRYELLERLDQDSLGESFRAADRQLLCEVRLKRFHEHLTEDPALRRRFVRELLALRRLTHPAVLAGYELGEDGAVLFFTTELPSGRPLSERLSGGPLSAREALRLFRQLLEALAHVHECGVLHRDLQPRHLHVDEACALKVGGFGLGHLGDLASATAVSQVISSPRHRAPEVLLGGPASVASDLYSAGLVLAEMLTGRPIWTQDSIVEQARAKSERVADWARRLGLEGQRAEAASVLLPGLLEPEPLRRFQNAEEALGVLGTLEQAETPGSAAGRAQELEALARPAGAVEEICLVCGEQIGARLGECLGCGLSLRSLAEWRRGPWSLLLRTVLSQSPLRSELGDDPARRLEAMRLLERFWGPLSEDEGRKLARGIVVALGVDASTADMLERVFAARSIPLQRLRLGALGAGIFGFWSRVRAWIPPTFFYGFTFLLAPVALFLMPNAVFSAGYSMAAATASGIAVVCVAFCILSSGLFLPELPGGAPKFRWVEAAEPEPDSTELREAYRGLEDPALRLAARRIVSELRAAASGRPECAEPLRRLELQVLRLLESVSQPHPEDRGELLAAERALEGRLAVAPEQLRPELEKALRDAGAALDRLAEAEARRVRVEERLGRCLQALRSGWQRGAEAGDSVVRVERAVEDLLALERPAGLGG